MKGDQALVPTLWWFELRNALVVNERRGRITEQQTARFLRNVERLAITIDGTPDESGVLTLARRHRLTVYDAAYLELAVRNALPLATLDAMLATAARSEGVPLFGDDARIATAVIFRPFALHSLRSRSRRSGAQSTRVNTCRYPSLTSAQ
jgi:predicted nucleic acid-binding protein